MNPTKAETAHPTSRLAGEYRAPPARLEIQANHPLDGPTTPPLNRRIQKLRAFYRRIQEIAQYESSMRIHSFLATAFMALSLPCHGDEPDPKVEVDVLSNPVIARSLADACDIVRLINELKWKDAKKRLIEPTQAAIIEPLSRTKDWHGIGAYRGSEIDNKKRQVKHRFSYGEGRITIHEVWIIYRYSDDDFKKPVIQVLGW